MKVAGATKIGVLADGGRFGGVPGRFVGFDEGGDAFAVQATDLERAGRNGFGLRRLDHLVELENAEACSEALFRMRAAGKDGDDEPLGLWTDRAAPAPEALRLLTQRHYPGFKTVRFLIGIASGQFSESRPAFNRNAVR